MKHSIKILEQEEELIRNNLKNGVDEQNNRKRISEIKKAIQWLKKIEELQLKNVTQYEITELPDMQTGYSEYRIMNDCEGEDRQYWVEYEGHRSGLIFGDILISKKRYKE